MSHKRRKSILGPMTPIEKTPDTGHYRASHDMEKVSLETEENLATGIPSLTADEIKWIRRLQRTLRACPYRLALVNSGDPSFYVVDKNHAKIVDLHDGQASRNGVVLATVAGKPTVYGVSG